MNPLKTTINKAIFVGISVLMLATSLLAQPAFQGEDGPNPNDYSRLNFKYASAYYSIECLKEGVLLVRLQTKQKAIDRFTEIGDLDAAKRVKDKQDQENNDIIEAFKMSYNFTNVYFFTSDYSDKVRAHDLNAIPFLDQHIVDTRNMDLDTVKFLVAEFTTLAPDTSTARVNSYTYDEREKKGASVNSNMGISALVFKSDQIVQLERPFPYYVRAYSNFLSILFINKNIRSKANVIKKAQEDLMYFSRGVNWRDVERNVNVLSPEEIERIRKSKEAKDEDD